MLRCMSPELALFGPHPMSDVSPECASKRKSASHSGFMGSQPPGSGVA